MTPPQVTLALCALAALVEGFDTQAMGVAAPMLVQEFGLNPTQAGWLFSLGTVGQVIGALIGGRVADRIGRKRALITSMVLFAVCSGLTALLPGVGALFTMRLLTGIGLGGALPNIITIASESAEPKHRLWIATLITAALPLGGAMAGLTALWGASDGSWREIFYAGAAAPLLLALAMGWLLPESLGERLPAHSQGGRGAHEASMRVGTILFGKRQAATTTMLWTAFFFAQMTLFLMMNWLPSLMVQAGYSKVEASWCSIVFNVSGSVGSILIGRLQSRGNRAFWVGATYVGVACALAGIGLTGQSLPVVLVACSCAGFFVIGAQLTLFGAAPLYYSRAQRGTGVGAAVAVGRAGSVVGPLYAGHLLGGGSSAALVLLGIQPFVVLGGAAALLLCWRSQNTD